MGKVGNKPLSQSLHPEPTELNRLLAKKNVTEAKQVYFPDVGTNRDQKTKIDFFSCQNTQQPKNSGFLIQNRVDGINGPTPTGTEQRL